MPTSKSKQKSDKGRKGAKSEGPVETQRAKAVKAAGLTAEPSKAVEHSKATKPSKAAAKATKAAQAALEAKFKMSRELRESHFWNHMKNDASYVEEERRCHYCQFRSWSSHRHYPMSIVIDQDDFDVIPPEFVFIEKNIIGEGVELPSDETKTGCICTDDIECMLSGCQCLQDVMTEEMKSVVKVNAYHVAGERKGCLREEMLGSGLAIYECSERCNCSDKCANRVVGNGRKVTLQVFKTPDGRGWGVRSTEDIKRGQYVGNYVGELITSSEANRRRKEAKSSKKKDIYLFALDKWSDPNSLDERLRGEPYEIDGEFYSGPTRFINHACDPNLRIYARVTSPTDYPFHDLCFFALKDIDRLTELTFDYTDGIKSAQETESEFTNTHEDDKHKTRCLCGAKNCRGYLW